MSQLILDIVGANPQLISNIGDCVSKLIGKKNKVRVFDTKIILPNTGLPTNIRMDIVSNRDAIWLLVTEKVKADTRKVTFKQSYVLNVHGIESQLAIIIPQIASHDLLFTKLVKMYDSSVELDQTTYNLVYYGEIFKITFAFNGQYIEVSHPEEVIYGVSHIGRKTAGFVVRQNVTSIFRWIQYKVEIKRRLGEILGIDVGKIVREYI